jgi:hypothetical protein
VTQPVSSHLPHGGNTTYSVVSTISSASYQWQGNAGMGFVDLSNAGPYLGVNTANLTVTGVAATMNNYQYRCIVGNGYCVDTSTIASLTTSIQELSDVIQISLYPNPSTKLVTVHIINQFHHAQMHVFNSVGQLEATIELNAEKTGFDISAYPKGMHIVRLQVDGKVIFKNMTKI